MFDRLTPVAFAVSCRPFKPLWLPRGVGATRHSSSKKVEDQDDLVLRVVEQLRPSSRPCRLQPGAELLRSACLGRDLPLPTVTGASPRLRRRRTRRRGWRRSAAPPCRAGSCWEQMNDCALPSEGVRLPPIPRRRCHRHSHARMESGVDTRGTSAQDLCVNAVIDMTVRHNSLGGLDASRAHRSRSGCRIVGGRDSHRPVDASALDSSG